MIYPRSDVVPGPIRTRWALALAGLWLAGFPSLLHADFWPFVSTTQKEQQIQMRSAADKERLARNLKTFEAFSPEERARYRKLQTDLAEDRRLGGGLSEVLDQYCKWLTTLSEADREKLRSETNYSRRAETVRRMIASQPKPEPDQAAKAKVVEAKEAPAVVAQEPAQDEFVFAPDDPYLSQSDLAAVMAIYERALLSTSLLKEPEKERLRQKQGIDRYLLLLTFYLRREPGTKERWLNDSSFRAMVLAIENPDQQKKIQLDQTPIDKHKDLFFLIRRGIHKELEAEIERDIGRRTEVYDSLLYEDRERIKDVPSDKQAGAIAEAYERKTLRPFAQSNPEARKQRANQQHPERERAKPGRKD